MNEKDAKISQNGKLQKPKCTLLVSTVILALGRQAVTNQESHSEGQSTARRERAYSPCACVLQVPAVIPAVMGCGVQLGTALSSLGKGTDESHADRQSAETQHAPTQAHTCILQKKKKPQTLRMAHRLQ